MDGRKRPTRQDAPRPRRPSSTPAPKVVHERRGALHVEIVTVGREILRGRIEDAHGSWLASELCRRGALVHRITTVDDSERSVAAAVSEALGRGAHLVVTTGGLGPTLDDRTLTGVSQALRLPLALHPEARRMVERAYARLTQSKEVASAGLTAAREKMCSLPIGCEAVENAAGVAPGMLVRLTGGGAVLCLPGVGEEMKAVFGAALGRLKGLLPSGVGAQREIESPTKDESALRPWLDRVAGEYPNVWIKTHPAGFGRRKTNVIVSIESFAATRKEADALVDGALRRLLALAGGGR
jgi:molybdenum cofactor synthesis domain-containing protein